jgi:hypothetical protein
MTTGNLIVGTVTSLPVISFLHDRRIEIIEVQFSLKRNLVIGVEKIEGERSLWLLERRGVPIDAQELAILLDPSWILRARTKLHVEMMYSVDVDNEKGLAF